MRSLFLRFRGYITTKRPKNQVLPAAGAGRMLFCRGRMERNDGLRARVPGDGGRVEFGEGILPRLVLFCSMLPPPGMTR